MAESRLPQKSKGSATLEQDPAECQRSPTVTLKLKKSEPDRKVKWGEDTVDNEHMNKKKSKCCCIYQKPRIFGESSDDESNDEDDDHGCTDHCRGHGKKDYRKSADDAASHGQSDNAGPPRDVGASK